MPNPPPDQPSLLPIEPEHPEPTANDLTRAWCTGYHDARGRWPHPNVMKRVGRVSKNIGKDCATIEDWRAAWQAAYTAGRQGRWDITAVLIDAQPPNLHAVSSVEHTLRTVAGQAAIE